MSFIITSPADVAAYLAKTVRKKRLSLNLSQRALSASSGVSMAVIKKFEVSGKISLESLLKIALPLNSLDMFLELFKPAPLEDAITLDELLKKTTERKRG